MQAMKFRVNSPEHSEQIQKKLFEMGYGWNYPNKDIRHTGADFLFADEYGCVTFEGSDKKYFENHKYKKKIAAAEELQRVLKSELKVQQSIETFVKMDDQEWKQLAKMAQIEDYKVSYSWDDINEMFREPDDVIFPVASNKWGKVEAVATPVGVIPVKEG